MSTFNRREFMGRSLAGASIAASSYQRILGANDRLSVGIIGCGGRGLLREVLQFTKETNAQVTAVCDTWRQQREKASEQVRQADGNTPEQLIRYQDLLGLKGIDAVVIGTPDHQHCTMLAAAARAGKDAYCEKPLAMNLKELNEAVDAVKKNNRVVQIGTQVRSWAPSVAGRAFVQSGGLGRIFKIEQSRNGARPYWYGYGERAVTEADVDWKGFLMNQKDRPFHAKQYAGWYGFREFSRGPQTNLFVHFIDLVHYVTGAQFPRSVVAAGGKFRFQGDEYTNPDSVEIALEYPEGFLVRYCSTFGTSANSFLKFIGTKGVMDASAWNKPWVLSGEGSTEPDRLGPGAVVPPAEGPHHMKNFLDCVRSRQTATIAPIEAGYSHSIATIMADEAFITGRRMVFDPARKSIHAG
ncbi:MAG: Gfo/Idh/MocA family oxidoreductase [Bryobacterales bacterium]|nr:Gfo/Idh/MocA family oxidoreductase [Bryobacterales bacterium]